MGLVLTAGAVAAGGEAGAAGVVVVVVPLVPGHSGNGTLVQALKASTPTIQARWRGLAVTPWAGVGETTRARGFVICGLPQVARAWLWRPNISKSQKNRPKNTKAPEHSNAWGLNRRT